VKIANFIFVSLIIANSIMDLLNSFQKRNKIQTDSHSALFAEYLFLKKSPAPFGVPNEISHESELRAKIKQIEGQQALLFDLQSQLSAKESEISRLNSRVAISENENSTLQKELISLNLRLLEKCASSEKQDSITPSHIPLSPSVFLSPLPRPSRACVPRKPAIRTLGVLTSAPNRFAGDRGSSAKLLAVAAGNRVSVMNRINFHIEADFDLADSVPIGLDLSPDGSMVLTGTTDGQLLHLDVSSLKIKSKISGCLGKIKNCGYLGNSSYKGFSASTDRCLRIYDLSRGEISRSFSTSSQMVDATCSEDGSVIATAHQNGQVILWNENEKIATIEAHKDSCVGLDISRCGRFLTSLGMDDGISVIDLQNYSSPLFNLKSPGFTTFQDTSFPCISPDGQLVAACGASDGAAWCFDLIHGNFSGKLNMGDSLCLFWGSSKGDKFEMISGHRNGNLKWWAASEVIK
jgi:WD40 repeat protein